MGARTVDEETIRRWIADAIAANSGGSSYLVYTAYLRQATGVNDAPTVVALFENTIGAIVWTRGSTGQYEGTLAGAFTLNKTVCPPTSQYSLIGLWGNNPFEYGFSIRSNDVNTVSIEVFKTSDGSSADLFTAIGNTPIFVEIRVYP